MNIIFLDFDGVITSTESGYKLSPVLLERLKRLLWETDAYMVITSSWRGGDKQSTINEITDPNNPRIGKVQFPYIDRILSVTPRCGAWMRGQEIEQWFNQKAKHLINAGKKEIGYVIIDDETDFYVQQKQHLVKTNEAVGLQDADIERAKEILKEKINIKDLI